MDTFAGMDLMREKTTPHLQQIIANGSTAIARQFLRDGVSENEETFGTSDPLGEESLYSPVKGIVHKFGNRALIKVSYRCSAHCLFCTRARQVGDPSGDLSEEDIDNCISYVHDHSEIDDVILSGGDPFVTPAITFKLLSFLATMGNVKVIRIGTRLPVHDPHCFKNNPVLELVKGVNLISGSKPVYVLVHINHPDELVPETRDTLVLLRKNCTALLSQSVFLNQINDSVEILGRLFKELYHLGVLPYYIYRCDSVSGLGRFICPLEKERHIMTELRRTLSGIALPTYVVDVAGRGKIPVPLDFWGGVDTSKCVDYDGQIIEIIQKGLFL